jgi:hypothetical protein
MASRNIDIANLTPHKDVNDFLAFFTDGTISILKENLIGIYLTGSLSYQAFNYNSSDIDITVILQNPVSTAELSAIKTFLGFLENSFNTWARRLDCSYTPVEMLPSVLPPKKPRPWYWGGERILYAEAPYGNEWIINNYLLYNHAISLFGPAFKELTKPINIVEVQKACLRDLFTEWEPKKANRDWFKDSYKQSYFILNLCRILYTVICKSAGSKKIATSWVKSKYGVPWENLINTAEQWQHGIQLNRENETIEFLNFVIDQVSKTELYNQLLDEIDNIRQPGFSVF